MNHRAVADADTRSEHDVGLDRDIPAERGVGREENRFRCDHRDAGIERRLTETRLHHLFRLRQLRLGVDAAHFIFASLDHHDIATERANERQKRVLGDRVIAHFGGHLDGKRVAVWGLAFKPETDDIRESPALTLIEQLRHAGAAVVAYDPAAAGNVRALLGDAIELVDDPYAATTHADALVLVTEWHELRHPDLDRLKTRMRQFVLFDGRNAWDANEARKAGFTYFGIGRR